MGVRIGELLLREQRLTPAQLEQVLACSPGGEDRLGLHVVRLGYLPDEDLTALLSTAYGVASIDLARFAIAPSAIDALPSETAWKYRAIPLHRSSAMLTLALADPGNVFAIDDIQFMTGCRVEPLLASEIAVLAALRQYYPDGPEAPGPAPDLRHTAGNGPLQSATSVEMVAKALEDTPSGSGDDLELLGEMEQIDIASLERLSTEAPVIRIVNLMLTSAIQRGASDIHVEPYERDLRVRFRIDGVLHNVLTPPLRFRDAIASRLKIMSRLDIAEKRLPQDGRMKIRFRAGGAAEVIDFRVSSLPTLFGEKMVLRLLDARTLRLDMALLGLDPAPLEQLEAAVARPWGMVLVTGPTGSGKTTTLYSALARLNTFDTNIMTVEDPIEFNLPGVNQVQVRDSIGLTFAGVLRAFLRQDPDVILVGEVRDPETAAMAVKAALTGHLVLSTLHTNDAPGAIARLATMGIEPLLMATTVNLVCAQRLVRRICDACIENDSRSVEVLLAAGFTLDEARRVAPKRGSGCARCGQTGYAGRIGLYEVMPLGDHLRELILRGASGLELGRAAAQAGMVTLRRSGLRKVMDGVTTLAEVLRETAAGSAA